MDESVKLKFKEYFSRIKEIPGVIELFNYIKEHNYFVDPASARFHSAFEGGLLSHSVNVTSNLVRLTELFNIKWERPESPYIIGLFHDLCKLDFYKIDYKNAKNDETGKWEKVPYYTVSDAFPIGHGAKSVIILQKFLKLTDQEIVCIVHHMGAFCEAKGQLDYSNACSKYPEIMLVALADQMAGVSEDNPIKSFNI